MHARARAGRRRRRRTRRCGPGSTGTPWPAATRPTMPSEQQTDHDDRVRRAHPERTTAALASDSTAHPVGLASVLPSPPGFHPDVKSPHSSRGLSGNGRNSPTDRDPGVEQRAAAERRSPRRRRSRRSPGRASSPATGARWSRRRRRSRCRASAGTTSAGRSRGPAGRGPPPRGRCATWRSSPAGRRASASAGRARSSARSDAHASPSRPVNRPTTSSTSGEHDQLERTQRQTSAAGERGDGAHPVAGPQRVVVEVGAADRRAPRGGAPGPAGTTTTRAPLRWARQHRSTSSPWNDIAGSKPPSVRNRSARTSMQADGSDEHVAHRVVLLLVDLAGLGDRVDLAEAVERRARRAGAPPGRPSRRASARRRRRSTGTAPRRAAGPRRDRARRRRGRAGRTRCRPRRAAAPRWPPRRSPDCRRARRTRASGRRRRIALDGRRGSPSASSASTKSVLQVRVVLGGERSDASLEPCPRRGRARRRPRPPAAQESVGFHQSVGAAPPHPIRRLRRRRVAGARTPAGPATPPVHGGCAPTPSRRPARWRFTAPGMRSLRSLTVERGSRAGQMARRHTSVIIFGLATLASAARRLARPRVFWHVCLQ